MILGLMDRISTDRSRASSNDVRRTVRGGQRWMFYATAVTATILATLCTDLAASSIVAGPFTAFYFTAVAFSAWFGGVGPGLLATLLSGLFLDFFFLEPQNDLWPSMEEIPYLLSFGGAALLVSFLTSARERARQHAEKLNDDLQRHVHELETLLEVIPVGIGIARDAQCSDIRVNPYFARALGIRADANASLSAGDTSPRNFRVLHNGQEVRSEDLPMQRAGRTGKDVRDVVMDVVHSDGRIVTLMESAAPLFDADGNVRGSVGAFLDITEQQRIQRELRAANVAKDRFLAVLSHELRTPLTPVLAIVSMLDRDTSLSAALREDLSMIRRNVELEARLIDDLLDLTRIARGRLQLHRETLDVGRIIEHAVEMTCASAVAQGRLSIRCELGARRQQIQADAGRLTQLFWNLLNNAVKFTPQGGSLFVRSFNETDAAGDWLAVEVRDTGIGIPPDMLPKIFDAFEQADSDTSRQYGGLGLGLAISKAIVELHDGSIAAHSDGLQAGATFTVRLPVADVFHEKPTDAPGLSGLPAHHGEVV